MITATVKNKKKLYENGTVRRPNGTFFRVISLAFPRAFLLRRFYFFPCQFAGRKTVFFTNDSRLVQLSLLFVVFLCVCVRSVRFPIRKSREEVPNFLGSWSKTMARRTKQKIRHTETGRWPVQREPTSRTQVVREAAVFTKLPRLLVRREKNNSRCYTLRSACNLFVRRSYFYPFNESGTFESKISTRSSRPS